MKVTVKYFGTDPDGAHQMRAINSCLRSALKGARPQVIVGGSASVYKISAYSVMYFELDKVHWDVVVSE